MSKKSSISQDISKISKDLLAEMIHDSQKKVEASESSRRRSVVFQIVNDLRTETASRKLSMTENKKSNVDVLLSKLELELLRVNQPMDFYRLTEEISVNNQKGIWLNKNEIEDWRGEIPLNDYKIFDDLSPKIIQKANAAQLKYIQKLSVKYLKPNTPEPLGDVILNQAPNFETPPAPPIIIRQTGARAVTPNEIVYREKAPMKPERIAPKVVVIKGNRIPPPPRKVIIEKLANDPPKPPPVAVERWLAYEEQERRVVFNKNTIPDPVIPNPKNLIIKWDAPECSISKSLNYMGVSRMNPDEYNKLYGSSLYDSIDLPEIVTSIKTPDNLVLAANYKPRRVPKLVGDLDALKLIDLEANGLGEYREQLAHLESKTTVEVTSESLIRQAFDAIDSDAGGTITLDEARDIFHRINHRLGRSYTEQEMKWFFQTLDKNGDGHLEFSEFKRAFEEVDISVMYQEYQNSLITSSLSKRRATGFHDALGISQPLSSILSCPIGEECTIDEIFEQVDVDRDGQITKEETAKTLLHLNTVRGRSYGQDELEIFFSALDRDRNGSISMDEFKKAFNQEE